MTPPPDDAAETFIAAGDDAAAAARLGEAIARGGLSPADAAGLRLRRATCWFRLEKYDEAFDDARLAFEIESKHRADAAHLQGEIRKRQGRWDEASAAFDRAAALATDPARARLARFLGSICVEEMGDLEKSAHAWRAFLALHPGDAEGYYRLGLVQERRGDATAAREAFEMSLAASAPDAAERPAALFRLALLDKKTGHLERAIARLEEAAQAAGETFLGTTARNLAADLRAEWGLAKRGMRAYDPRT